MTWPQPISPAPSTTPYPCVPLYPHSPLLHMLCFGSHSPVIFSQDLCTCSSSARNSSLTFHMLSPSHCHLSLRVISSEYRWTIHWPAALNFLHSSIFTISVLGPIKYVIVYHPLRLQASCRDHACIHPCLHNTQQSRMWKGLCKYVFNS